MSLVRCEKHGSPKGTKNNYVRSVKPVGYPNTSTICGTAGCENPGLIGLNETEAKDYDKGQRVFTVPTYAVKVRAQ